MNRRLLHQGLIESMAEGLLALRQGKELPSTYRPRLPEPPTFTDKKVSSLRTSYGLTQTEFSALLKVSPKTIQSWEQGTRKPSGTALRLLQLLHSPKDFQPIIKYRSLVSKKR